MLDGGKCWKPLVGFMSLQPMFKLLALERGLWVDSESHPAWLHVHVSQPTYFWGASQAGSNESQRIC